MADEPKPWTNRLAQESSAYLRQHAHNPVDWYPWGEEAFERARDADKPIFLSIGYAACHWCHVMERESFDDPLVAAFLNTHFVPVKVDREERPDVDALYIEALLRIHGQAGWPANLFLFPDLRPFTGATYLPPQPAYGMPSFRQVLERVAGAWRRERDGLEDAGKQLVSLLATAPEPGKAPPGHEGYQGAVRWLVERHDPVHGGFGTGQKFPQVPQLELLLLGAHDGLPGAAEALAHTLKAMDEGGLHDQLGGGFHRYCVDRSWTVPHFEKMLYDNAQLLRLYARASALFAALGQREAVRDHVRVARDTAAYLLRDLRHESGAFQASEDADDPGGEGHFYTFTPEEAREVLGGEEPLPYGIRPEGNFEGGRTVLTTREGHPPRAVREALREHRDQRPRPARDPKAVTAWNGLALGALAEAGRLFGDRSLVDEAARCAEAVLASRDAEGGLPRVLGTPLPGTLDDHAAVADGLLDLYQARPHEHRWLDEALALARVVITRFHDPEGGGFFQSEARDDLVVRRKVIEDGAEPSGYGRFCEVLRRLLALGTDLDPALLHEALRAAAGTLGQHPAVAPELWGVVRALATPPWELVVAGTPGDPRTQRLLRAWNRTWRPQGLLAQTWPGAEAASRFTLLEGRLPDPDGHPLAYPCRRGACALPVNDPDALGGLLEGGDA